MIASLKNMIHRIQEDVRFFARHFVSKLYLKLRFSKRSDSRGYMYYRHKLPVRIMHWGNALFLAILLMSGLGIFNVHPALYWGISSYQGDPPVLEMGSRTNAKGEITGVTRILGRDFNTTGFLGVSRGLSGELARRGFPSWLTIPDGQWLAMARRWHFFFAWLLVINGVSFIAYSAVSRHLAGDLLPRPHEWRTIGRSIIDHLLLKNPHGEEARQYNILQKLAYLGVIFFLLPFMVLMGMGMSPALNALYPGWVDIFAGRQSVRTLHFIFAGGLVLFFLIHIFEVAVSGLWNNLRSMITGFYRIETEDCNE